MARTIPLIFPALLLLATAPALSTATASEAMPAPDGTTCGTAGLMCVRSLTATAYSCAVQPQPLVLRCAGSALLGGAGVTHEISAIGQKACIPARLEWGGTIEMGWQAGGWDSNGNWWSETGSQRIDLTDARHWSGVNQCGATHWQVHSFPPVTIAIPEEGSVMTRALFWLHSQGVAIVRPQETNKLEYARDTGQASSACHVEIGSTSC